MRPYGCARDPTPPEGPLAPGLTRSTTFAARSAEQMRAIGAGEQPGEFYPRYGHPAGRAFESRIAELEGADGAVSFSSGMAALHGSLCALLSTGDTLAVAHDLYGGTAALITKDLPRFGIKVRRFDATANQAALRTALGGASLALVETPTNPLLKLVDLAALSRAAAAEQVTTLVDATFMPPPLQRPLDAGIDLVMHSATKFFGGHHDCLAGVVSGGHRHCELIESFRRRSGAILAPESAWLLLRSLKTLELRVERCVDTAARLAAFLEHRGLAVRQASALVTFEVDDAPEVFDRFEKIARAVSLGGVDTTALLPMHTSHAMIPADERRRLGISDRMIRLSVGLEPFEELAGDLERALA